MDKVALVLSGGGARGAFQVAAEKYAREVKGYKWDIIAGVSVGALNGVMLAMEKYERLEKLWQNISRDRVYTGALNAWTMARTFMGAQSIYGNEPLRKIVEEEVDSAQVKADLRIGTVSLWTGDFQLFSRNHPEFQSHLKEIVLASTTMPIVWEPIDLSPNYRMMVDGGLRNTSPIGDVLDGLPGEVVIINCSPAIRTVRDREKPFRNVLEIGRRSLEIAMNEIFFTDLREFVRINQNVRLAERMGVKLYTEKGRELKYYDCKIIQPETQLGDALDFSQEAVQHSFESGWAQAKKVLG